MNARVRLLAAAALTCAACNPAANTSNEASRSGDESNAVSIPDGAENVADRIALPDDRTPLEEPKGPIDPRSAEAAGQVVQHYGALIEQGRWTDSWQLWSNAADAKAFDRNWREDSEIHMAIGKPGGMEGAAGSSYVTVPAMFYGKTKAGGSFRRAANVVLRRVNDVPGSTEAQRRWHIERIDWAST